jgi:hypothetical protein
VAHPDAGRESAGDELMSLSDPTAGTLDAQVGWRLNVFAVSWNKSF